MREGGGHACEGGRGRGGSMHEGGWEHACGGVEDMHAGAGEHAWFHHTECLFR